MPCDLPRPAHPQTPSLDLCLYFPLCRDLFPFTQNTPTTFPSELARFASSSRKLLLAHFLLQAGSGSPLAFLRAFPNS